MQELKKYIASSIRSNFDLDIIPDISRTDPEFGDYATNVAMQLAGRLKQNPRDVAAVIKKDVAGNSGIKNIEIAGPGFINITLTPEKKLEILNQNYKNDTTNESIVIETNNPNPFKAMHIGHAFNAILADTIANLLDVSGADVNRVSYHGDVGLHVGKSMYSLLKYANGDFSKIESIPESDRNSFMSKMYAEGSKTYKNDEQSKKEIDRLSEQSFRPDSELYSEIYNLCKKWSFGQIDKTVARLGNKPTVYRFLESEADYKGVDIVKQNTPSVFQESDGALIFHGSQHGSFDNVFVSKNGRGLYAARDLGLMEMKNDKFQPTKSYIVTAEEQKAYFKGVIAASEMCFSDDSAKTINIATGTVLLSTGKMSSRDGDVVAIEWLFDEFKNAIEQRGGKATDDIIAGALRYQFLKIRIGSDVVFDIDEAVSLTGNTGNYLQYAHARARSIIKKSDNDAQVIDDIYDEDESIIRKMSEYPEVLSNAISDLSPHSICNYLFDLAQEFNRYYEKNKIIGNEREQHRLNIVNKYADIIKNGLSVLGIVAPDSM